MKEGNPLDSLNPIQGARKNAANIQLDSMKDKVLSKNNKSSLAANFENPTTGGASPFKGFVDFSSAFQKKRENQIDLSPKDVRQEDIYKEIGNEMVAKYPTYYKGMDNNEIYANQQSTGEKWSHGLQKLGLKTATAVAGGTAGFFTGVANAIDQGSLSAMYTDDFNQMLDEYNEKLDLQLPNYYSEQERDAGFFESMGTANFWANDVLGGLSFTLGAIVSEGIWGLATGGTSLIAKGALGTVGRWSTKALGANKALKGMAKFKEPTKRVLNNTASKSFDDAADAFSKNSPMGKVGGGQVDEVLQLGRGGDNLMGTNSLNRKSVMLGHRIPKALNQARFIMTSAGYEAGVEARHYIKETEEEFIMDFEERNGRKPNQDELTEFKVNLNSSANAVWGANMALVGSSNMAIFGKMLLGKSTRPAVSNSAIKRSLFGVGYDVEKGVAKAVTATKGQKIAGRAYSVVKAPLIEGIYEEGGQSVAAKTVKDYILDGYDPETTQDSISMMDSLIEGFSSTYGTKEGRKEVGIGMIIGLFGGGLSTGGRFNDIGQERQNIENLTNYRNEYTPERVLASQITSARMVANNRIMKANQRQEEAASKGDVTGEFISEQQAILASIERDSVLQGTKQGIADFEAYLNTVNDTELAEELGINESEIGEWKTSKLEEYTALSEKYQENERFVRALLGDQNFAGTSELNTSSEQIIKAITYNMTLGDQSKEFTKKIVEDIKTTIAGEFGLEDATTALDVDMVLSEASSKSIDKYMNLSKKYKNLEDQRNKLEAELISAQYNKQGTDSEVYANRLNSIQGKIVSLDTQMNEIRQNKETAFRALGIQNETVTLDDVDAQAQRIQELRDVVEGYKSSNPHLYLTLTKLFDEYNKAKKNTVGFQNLTKELADPKLRVDVINGWLTGLLKKNKSLDEHTRDFFKTQLEQYETNQVQGKVFSGEAMDRTQTDNTEEPESDVLRLTEGDEMSAPVERATPITRRTPLEAIREMVSDIMNKNTYVTSYIGDNFDEAVKRKPSEEDVNRYEELLGKINTNYITKFEQLIKAPEGWFKNNGTDTGLSETELAELKELQTKLSQWKVLEGSKDGSDNSIADLILLAEQLETEVEKSNTKTGIMDNEYATMKQASEKEVSEGYETSEGVQSPDQALVNLIDIAGEATYSFSHLDVSSLPRLFPDSTLELVKGKTTKLVSEMSEQSLKEVSKTEGTEFVLNTPQGAVKIKIGKRSRLNISKKSLDNSLENSNIAIVNYGSGTFRDVYERLSNGDLVPLRGDFSYASALKGENIELVPDVVNNIKEGQVLVTKINRNDAYNKALVAKYNKSNKTEEDFNTLMNDLHIYISDQTGQVVGSLRASKADLPDNNATKNLLELRRKAVNMFLSEGTEGDFFNLNEVIPVRTVLMGSPNFIIEQQEDGTLKPQSIDFTDTALEKVEDVGYLEGDTLRLRNLDSDNVIKTFLPKNSAQKMPVTILKINGKSVAFPVSLKSTTVDNSSRVREILETSLRMTDKISRINSILIENGLKPSEYINDSKGRIEINEEKVIEDLSTIEDFPNLAEWLKGSYKLENLKNEAQIGINLDNNPFNLSKIMLDLSKTKTIGRADQMRMKYDNIENREIELRENLQSAVSPILDGMNNYPDVDDVRWTNVLFAENELYKNPKTDVERRHNVNLLRNALYNNGKRVAPPKAVREAYGEEFIENLRRDIEALDDVIETKKKTRAAIKNATVKKQKDNENTTC